MAQSSNNQLIRQNTPVISTDEKKIVIEFDQGASDQAIQVISNHFKEMTELLHLKLEQNSDQIRDVQKAIKSKYITPEKLNALESLIDKKARKYIDKSKGIQLNIDVLLNYDEEGLKDFQKLVNKEYGRTKSRIWVDLNKECLERKGTEPKNRILDTQVEQAFDYVRKWGGFSV